MTKTSVFIVCSVVEGSSLLPEVTRNLQKNFVPKMVPKKL